MVLGSQYNHTNTHQERDWKRQLRDDYDRIPLGRIKLIRTFDGQYNAHRVAHTACVLGDSFRESSPLLAISYGSRDAAKLFKHDYLRMSRIRHSKFMQFRGYNDSHTPMIIFQDDLLPVQHVIRYHRHCSQTLVCYLSYQGCLISTSVEGSSLSSMPYSCDNLWVRPQTGAVCVGLEGPTVETRFDVRMRCTDGWFVEIPALSMDMYDDEHIISYLANRCPSPLVLSVLAKSYVGGVSRAPLPLHCQHDVFSRISGQSIGRFPIEECRGRFECLYVSGGGGGIDGVKMEDGTTRFTLTHSNILREHDKIRLSFRIYPYSHRYVSWLAQAPFIFDTLGIHRDDWADFVLDYGAFTLELLSCVSQANNAPQSLPSPCYLFILPPPDLFYWSLDSNGRSRLPEGELGLPSYTPTVGEFEYIRWNADVYDFLRRWQLAKGFDPCTMEFAHSIGASLYDIDLGHIEREASRFEEVCAKDELCHADCREVSMAETSWDMDVDSPSARSEMVSPEEEVDYLSTCVDDMRMAE
ncbi:hypothetical protein AAF712_014626 [Marasmius tenuissimus]|uniref:Uncharacterized protein n=1 Tax=Marasmius tenuissimus TaxID=585030 RepID=A0ABR2ZAJ7_9AGAR